MWALVAVMVLMGPEVWAADAGLNLSRRLICYVYSNFSGTIGLLVGFCIALYGLWMIIQGSLGGGVFLIAGGAVVSQLPGLVASTLSGVQGILKQSEIADKSGADVYTEIMSIAAAKDNCDGAFQVDLSAYENKTPVGGVGGVGDGAGAGGVGTYANGGQKTDQLCVSGATDCKIWQKTNNIGNIKAIPGYTYPGQTDVYTTLDKNGQVVQYAVFGTVQDSLARIDTQMNLYSTGKSSSGQFDTIASQINTYAPPTSNGMIENNTTEYVASVVQYMNKQGFNVNQNTSVSSMSTAERSAYIQAVGRQETGKVFNYTSARGK